MIADRLFKLAAAACLSLLSGCTLADISPEAIAYAPQGAPNWLEPYLGDADGQISPVVLGRARALHQAKLASGAVRNACYFAMDATRPSLLANGERARRFYMICEDRRLFRAMSSGYGSGRDLPGIADFSNDQQCARNFGNAENSSLTTGGAYTTAEIRDGFKGYHRTASGEDLAFVRSFVQFEGEGATANARPRAIGGHQATLIRAQCRRASPGDPHADADGFVAFGKLVDYSAGRSNGCTSWSAADDEIIVSTVRNDPATVYIYPEAGDIEAVSRAVSAGRSPADAGTYWNSQCLAAIGKPRFWSAESLEPLIRRYEASRPQRSVRPLPICE
ncbi:hypothetical protein DYI37_07150 [Fulvimarina endophytica]|uniref:Uncharacterized protein n=1 Tax=Fulvimarina endophytica TaxID=2293836 RepID=A0A371X5N6_9HYPH|nr:hypothetical protein [Fulvimarina endophytica]RFC64527.1 hypothetical protein DYI37_07150 [Fulvimarina endophytica]